MCMKSLTLNYVYVTVNRQIGAQLLLKIGSIYKHP